MNVTERRSKTCKISSFFMFSLRRVLNNGQNGKVYNVETQALSVHAVS